MLTQLFAIYKFFQEPKYQNRDESSINDLVKEDPKKVTPSKIYTVKVLSTEENDEEKKKIEQQNKLEEEKKKKELEEKKKKELEEKMKKEIEEKKKKEEEMKKTLNLSENKENINLKNEINDLKEENKFIGKLTIKVSNKIKRIRGQEQEFI
jgi:hypothetical protein